MLKGIIFTIVFHYIIAAGIFAQSNNDFSDLELRLNNKAVSIVGYSLDDERIKQNGKVYDFFLEILEKEGSFEYPFDSLETISVLKSPDERFRIITWYVPLTDGSFNYFGFFQVRDDRNDRCRVYELIDRSEEINDLEYKKLDHKNWFGAYYYELIHNQYDGKDYYTLLGWRGNSPVIRQRVIESLRVSPGGEPFFGKQVFQYKDNLNKRIVFSYSARVSMALNYDRLFIEYNGGLEKHPARLIIFDRLVPMNEYLEGHYQFYAPEGNVFDGFVFEKGRWVFIPDVDARISPREMPEPKKLEQFFEND